MQRREHGVVLPRDFLRPCILLLLGEQRAHGYELLAQLRALGFTQPRTNGRYQDPGVYRALHRLETDGLVCSAREPSARGGHRRTYDLTEAGREELDRRAQTLTETSDRAEEFVSRFERAVSPRRRGRRWRESIGRTFMRSA